MNLVKKLITEEKIFYKKDKLPDIRIGDTVKVIIYLELSKADSSGTGKKGKERIQTYEGVVISKHGNKDSIDSTITVRKMFQGGGIEKFFLLNSPWIKSIQCMNSSKVRRGRLYYLRDRRGKSARLKRIF